MRIEQAGPPAATIIDKRYPHNISHVKQASHVAGTLTSDGQFLGNAPNNRGQRCNLTLPTTLWPEPSFAVAEC